MSAGKRANALLAAAAAFTLGATPAAAAPHLSAGTIHSLLTSKELWATIDVCNASDQPNVLGIRGSMPGDGRPRDRLLMGFRVQYVAASEMRWIDLGTASKPSFTAIGSGAASRQGGRSFQLVPVSGRPAFTLRGVVDFQWRRGGTVLLRASRPTTAGHQSLAGADPPGFSAATCLFG
jgi:hypothetical protein